MFAAVALRADRIWFETGATEDRSGFEPIKKGRLELALGIVQTQLTMWQPSPPGLAATLSTRIDPK
jgi:hypothetical protein